LWPNLEDNKYEEQCLLPPPVQLPMKQILLLLSLLFQYASDLWQHLFYRSITYTGNLLVSCRCNLHLVCMILR
jgi:hypothetical protein